MSKRKKLLADLMDMIDREIRENDDDDNSEEETFHMLVENLNDEDVDYILITPQKLTTSYRPGLWPSMDEVGEFLDDTFDNYPD